MVSKADIVSIKVDNIDDIMIRVKMLAVVEGVIDTTFLEILVTGITETIIDN